MKVKFMNTCKGFYKDSIGHKTTNNRLTTRSEALAKVQIVYRTSIEVRLTWNWLKYIWDKLYSSVR